jgi:hypothetical protein
LHFVSQMPNVVYQICYGEVFFKYVRRIGARRQTSSRSL